MHTHTHTHTHTQNMDTQMHTWYTGAYSRKHTQSDLFGYLGHVKRGCELTQVPVPYVTCGLLFHGHGLAACQACASSPSGSDPCSALASTWS